MHIVPIYSEASNTIIILRQSFRLECKSFSNDDDDDGGGGEFPNYIDRSTVSTNGEVGFTATLSRCEAIDYRW